MNENYLDDIQNVGITKLLGYLPLCTIIEEGVTVEQMIDEAESRGMKIFLFAQENCKVFSGALYVADIESLNIFLNQPKQRNILKRNKWPTDATAYVNMIASHFAHTPKLFELVALTFQDKRAEFQSRNAMHEVKAIQKILA
jgi:hypothetical protein